MLTEKKSKLYKIPFSLRLPDAVHKYRINIYSDDKRTLQGYRLGNKLADNSGVLSDHR